MSDKMKRSIRNKLVTMAIVVVAISIVLLGAVSWGGLNDMRKSSYIMSTELVSVSAENTEKIIQELALEDLRHLAEGIAHVIDAKLESHTVDEHLSEIGTIVMEVSTGEEGAIFIVDNDGNVIIRSHIDGSDDGVVTGEENIFTSESADIVEMVKKSPWVRWGFSHQVLRGKKCTGPMSH